MATKTTKKKPAATPKKKQDNEPAKANKPTAFFREVAKKFKLDVVERNGGNRLVAKIKADNSPTPKNAATLLLKGDIWYLVLDGVKSAKGYQGTSQIKGYYGNFGIAADDPKAISLLEKRLVELTAAKKKEVDDKEKTKKSASAACEEP